MAFWAISQPPQENFFFFFLLPKHPGWRDFGDGDEGGSGNGGGGGVILSLKGVEFPGLVYSGAAELTGTAKGGSNPTGPHLGATGGRQTRTDSPAKAAPSLVQPHRCPPRCLPHPGAPPGALPWCPPCAHRAAPEPCAECQKQLKEPRPRNEPVRPPPGRFEEVPPPCCPPPLFFSLIKPVLLISGNERNLRVKLSSYAH